MTILQSLNAYYDRMAEQGEAELPGWSREKFGFCIVLSNEGQAVDVLDLRDLGGKKPVLKLYQVPAGVKRTVGIAPNFLWDKSAYVLGCTAGEGKRTAQEHAAFKALHAERLVNATDDGLAALQMFLARWVPELFAELPNTKPELLDANIMFRLEGDACYLHERPAAKALITASARADCDSSDAIQCLITGNRGAGQRLHPTIKGVEGGQSSGAALVSFNLDAFTSLGKEQGANAPTSEAAAFRYGAALNRMLDRNSPNRIARPIGDTTVVFWADADNPEVAQAVDATWAGWARMDEIAVTDEAEAAKLAETLESVAKGRPVKNLDAQLVAGTRFHILGLAPNAARLSVRFWETGSFGDFAQRLYQHYEDMRIDPPPRDWGVAPSVNRLLVRTTALGGEYKNIPRLLAGEVMRAVLTGGRYPLSLLAAVVMRIRAGDDPLSGWHAAVIRGVLNRDNRSNFKKEDVPVALDPNSESKAYQLGRLFAVLESAQKMALGQVNASIRDRYFGAASATPASVFPLLLRGVQNHLAKLRKDHKGGWIERELEDILDRLNMDLPRALPLADQGRFAIGYYHQRKEHFKGRPDANTTEPDAIGGDIA